MKLVQIKNDISIYGKIYRLFKTEIKLLLDSLRARKSFEEILEWRSKKEKIDIVNPKTFDDKLWYIKKHFYSALASKCADKATVREYVRSIGLDEILIPIYGIYTSPYEIDFVDLPDECYVKCSHLSGANYLFKKGSTDVFWLRKLFGLYLKRDYYAASREWVYKGIVPRIIIEKKLENKNNEPLRDYRMFCFNGILKTVMINVGTATEQGEHSEGVIRSFYTPEFEPIPEVSIKGGVNGNDLVSIVRPAEWNRMVDISQKLSKPFPFCRVDLYNIDGKIYLSELTFFPNSGINLMKPKEWAIKMGDWIDLEKCKSNPEYEYKE